MMQEDSLKTIAINYVWKNFTLFKDELRTKLPSDLIKEILLEYDNKIEDLVSLCKRNKNAALFVLKNERCRRQLGKYDQDYLFNLHEITITPIDADDYLYKLHSGKFLFEVCNAHEETRQYVLDNSEIFKNILSSADFNTIYDEKNDSRKYYNCNSFML